MKRTSRNNGTHPPILDSHTLPTTPKYTSDVKKYFKKPEDEAEYQKKAALRCLHVDTVHQEMRCTD